MLPTAFIINPKAGRGNLKRLVPLIESSFGNAGIAHTIRVTNGPGHATELARELSSNHPVIIAVGGDGTINEVLNGMGQSTALGFLPVGSGNDFSRMFAHPKSLIGALNILAQQQIRRIDLGYVRAVNRRGITLSRLFVNAVGIGIDANVAYQAQQMPILKGLAKYLVSAVKSVILFRPPTSELSFADRTSVGRHLLIAVGNGKAAGGGFFLTPDARLDDGLLDICWAKDLSMGATFKILPFVLSGSHGRFREVSFTKTTKLRVKADGDIPVHLDGEILGVDIREIEVWLEPKALSVLA